MTTTKEQLAEQGRLIAEIKRLQNWIKKNHSEAVSGILKYELRIAQLEKENQTIREAIQRYRDEKEKENEELKKLLKACQNNYNNKMIKSLRKSDGMT